MAPQPRGWQGHGQLGTGTQMVLPESCGSGHQVVSRKNKYWEKKGPADTGKTLAQDQQGERVKKKSDKYTETLAKSSTSLAHWVSLGKNEMKPPHKPTSGHLSRQFQRVIIEQQIKPGTGEVLAPY